MGMLLRGLAVIACVLCWLGAAAADVPPHLVGMARALLTKIDPDDFAKAGGPALSQQAQDHIRATRLRSWAGKPPEAAADPTQLAQSLGLDPASEETKTALAQVLAARDGAARDRALAAALALSRKPGTLDEARASFDNALGAALAPLQKRARLEGGTGETIDIEWDPETSSLLLRMGIGADEIVLHGSATATLADGKLSYAVEADDRPVTRLDPAMQEAIKASIFGVWEAGDGAQWMIRGGSDVEAEAGSKTDPAARAMAELDQARARLAQLEKEKLFIWVEPGGGEVIQKKFKRLPAPFRYDRARSENANRGEIAALRDRIAAAESDLKLPPVRQHDPLRLKNKDAGRAVAIEVVERSGRSFAYDEAAFDGTRLTASRTLRVEADISDLPDWVIKELVASWSPPEWIEFEAHYNPRDKSVRLEGLWWRLNVTYDPAYQNISSIHTPYSKWVSLKRADDDVVLRIVGLDGAAPDLVRHDQPFRVEARFTKAPQGPQQVLVKRDGGDEAFDLEPASEGADARIFRSGILYARSAQYARRKDTEGLFIEDRFLDEDGFAQGSAEWERLERRSRTIAAELFEGAWDVAQTTAGGAEVTGAARVNAQGTSARMALNGGSELYQSLDMMALRGTAPDPDFLEINFERVAAFGEEPSTASPRPLPKGKFIYFPTRTRSLEAELKGARAATALDLKPVPEETIHVLLKRRGTAHLAGGWNEVLENGDHGKSGQQTWVRGVEVVGAVVVEDQTKRTSPTTAFYPWGPKAGSGSSFERTVFVFGKNLPTTAGDAIVFKSQTPGITYLEPRLAADVQPSVVDAAWKKAALVPRKNGSVRDPEEVGVFVTARFDRTSEPGAKILTLNESPAAWLLDFADARGRAYFIDTPPLEGAATDIFQSSDQGYLELLLEAPIPFGKPLVFAITQDGRPVGEVAMAKVNGEVAEGREGLVYRSPPLHFFRSDREGWAPPDEPGAVKFDVVPVEGVDPETGNRFVATLTEPLRLSVPKPAEMRIVDEDEKNMSAVWQKALERAAACYGGKIKIDPRATSQENSNFILTELWSFRGPFKSAKVTIGDHAAALLIRDEFVRFSRALAETYTETSAYDSDLDKFIADGEASKGASDPLWKVMSSADGKLSAESMLDVKALAEQRQAEREVTVDFRREQLRAMLRAYVTSVYASIRRANGAGDCNVDELLVIAGQPVPMIAERILPRLVIRREAEGRTYFEPDVIARAYVRTLHIKGEEVRSLAEYAAIDDTYKALALAAVGGGVGALASRLGYLGAAAYATVTADAIDAAYFGAKGVLDYQKGEAFYEFSKGASAAYGADFFENAGEQRQSALGAAAGVLLPGAGVALGTLGDLRHLAKTGRGAEIARRLGTIDAAGLARLSEAERLDLLAYVDDVRRANQAADATGFSGRAEALLTSTGRQLDAGDKDFLKSFDQHAAGVQAQIERGREVASRLDTLDGEALKPLTAAERADLAAYVENVKFRERALASGDFGPRIAVPSAREAEVAGRYADMARAADAAVPSAAIGDAAAAAARVAPPPVVGSTPGIARAVDELPASGAMPAPVDAVPAPPRVADTATQVPPPSPVRGVDAPTNVSDAPRVNPQAADRSPPAGAQTADDVAPAPAPRPAAQQPPAADVVPPPPRVADTSPRGPPTIPARGADAPSTISEPPRVGLEPSADPNITTDFPSNLRDPLPPRPNTPVRVAGAESPVAEQFQWGPPLKPDTVIPLRGDAGAGPPIVVEQHLNNGASNSAYKLKRIPGEQGDWVARISKGAPDSLPNRVDQEGWRALDEVKGDDVLVPSRKGPFEVDGASVGLEDVDKVRLEVVEFVPYRAAEQIPKGGIPTPGQAIALDRAKRAFNAKGYVWLDNHPGNYGFKPRDPANIAADDWQVVVIDPGGIVKVVDEAGDAAGVARRMQTRLENPNPDIERYLNNARANGAGRMQNAWSDAAKVDFLEEYGKHIDLSRLGIDTPKNIGFRTDGMVFYPNVRALSKIDGGPEALENAYQALRGQGPGPVAAVPPAGGDTAKLTTPDLPQSRTIESSIDASVPPPKDPDGPLPGPTGSKSDPEATAPHPPPDPEETIALDIDAVSAELKNSTAPKLDAEKTIDDPVIDSRKTPDDPVIDPEKTSDDPVIDSSKTAFDPPPQGDQLSKTEDFPPPGDVDPANQARGPPGRKAAPFDTSNLSDKLDTSPDYKFAKPAPDVNSLKSGDDFFEGKPIEIPTGENTRLIPGDRIVSSVDGREVSLGKFIGQGAGATVFANKADPSQVVRIVEISAEEKANKLLHYDLVGRSVGEATQNADGNGFFRLTRTHGQFVATDPATGTRYLVTLEENLAHTGGGFTNAYDRFAAKPPNTAQELTKALAIREMNRRGVIWTDHKLKNFDIVENPLSPTGYQMLIFDTGGIRPVKGQFVHERARNAEALQRIFDQTPEAITTAKGKKILPPGFATRAMNSVDYMDNRVMGNAQEDWMPVFSPNQINRPDNYYNYSLMGAEDLGDFAAEMLNKDIRLPRLR